MNLIIITCFLGLGSCEKWGEGDGQFCVKCWPEWDEEVNWVYNVMPTEICDYDLIELQKAKNDYESKGYTCGEIKKQ